MNAMILAAGLGTRLRPLTDRIPKPLFSIAGKPNIQRVMDGLASAGCQRVIVNTHHLADRLDEFLSRLSTPLNVRTLYESTILGTGGGIKNGETYLRESPFFVINADVVTDVDYKALYDFHVSHPDPVTLVMHDFPSLANVCVEKDFVAAFYEAPSREGQKSLAFTGIQVLDPMVLDWIPKGEFSTSIEAYIKLLKAGYKIRAYTIPRFWWHDIGTLDAYRRAALEAGAMEVFSRKTGQHVTGTDLEVIPLSGDGSDRRWYRIAHQTGTIICADHGVRPQDGDGPFEVDAFVRIGGHLAQKGVAVPRMLFSDAFSGHAYLEDLGDTHLLDVRRKTSPDGLRALYEKVLVQLARLALDGMEGFDTSWTYQTPYYDQKLMMERESRYFTEAFVNGYLKMEARFADLEAEFALLAQRALHGAPLGFLHRDMQSRNIMMKDGTPYFIDFQGARVGPLQYDLASLLIDPYADLPPKLQADLAHAYFLKVSRHVAIPEQAFMAGYDLLALHRNMQALGAFAFLSGVKKKQGFAEHIPAGVSALSRRIHCLQDTPQIKSLVQGITAKFGF